MESAPSDSDSADAGGGASSSRKEEKSAPSVPYKHMSGSKKGKLKKEKQSSQAASDPKQKELTFFKSPTAPSASTSEQAEVTLSSPSPVLTPTLALSSLSPRVLSPTPSSSSTLFETETESEDFESDSTAGLISPSPDLHERCHSSASEHVATPSPLPLEVVLIEDDAETEKETNPIHDHDHGVVDLSLSSVTATTRASPTPTPTLTLSSSCPFLGFGEDHTTFSDADKLLLVGIHPVQPQSTPATKVTLLFTPLKTYYQEDGEQRKWLSYSESHRKLFCWICVGFCVSRSSVFITGWTEGEGKTWHAGHLSKSLSKHELSVDHMYAVEGFYMFQKQSSVDHKIQRESLSLRRRQIQHRREIVLRLIEIILFLAKQTLPFRARANEAAYSLKNTGCNHGNFLEEVRSRACFDPFLKSHLDNVVQDTENRHIAHPTSRGRGSLVTFLSKTTFLKILDITAGLILKHIQSKVIENGGTYSISMDGTQDVSVQEAMAFVLRYVDESGPKEHLVDVSIMKSTSSEALFKYTIDVLEKKMSLSMDNLKGYSFDGAGNMAGVHTGLQARLKQLVPNSVFQHCYAHILSLSLEKTCSAVLLGASTFEVMRETCTIIGESYKRSILWKSASSFLCNKTRLLVKLGKTRWWAKARACSRIFTDNEDSLLPVVIVALNIISQDKEIPSRPRFKALGELGKWCSFDTLAVGVLFNKIFQHTGPVSDYLQSPQLDHVQAARLTSQLIPDISAISIDDVLEEAKQLTEHCNEKLRKLNMDDEFTNLFGTIESEVAVVSAAATRRISTVPRRLGEVCEDEMRSLAGQNTANWYLKVNTLIPIKDHCITSLKDRFSDENLSVSKSCAFLSPGRFEEILKDGIPDGALDDLCQLSGTDSTLVAKELLAFARNYKNLEKTIQADYPSQVNYKEFDVDFEGNSDSEEDVFIGGSDINRNEENPHSNASAAPSCKGCLRCPYRILRKHGLYTTAFRQLCNTYKLALTLPCTQVSCERCFSKLKILKTRLRKKIAEDNLRNLMIISVEREILEKFIDRSDILSAFAESSNEMKRLLIL